MYETASVAYASSTPDQEPVPGVMSQAYERLLMAHRTLDAIVSGQQPQAGATAVDPQPSLSDIALRIRNIAIEIDSRADAINARLGGMRL